MKFLYASPPYTEELGRCTIICTPCVVNSSSSATLLPLSYNTIIS